MMREAFFQLVILQAIQVSILIVFAEGIHRMLGTRWPHFRYAMWLVILIKCLVPPIIVSPTGVFSWAQVSLAATAAAPPSDPLGWTTAASQWLAACVQPVGIVIVAGWLLGGVGLAISWVRAWQRFNRVATSAQTDATYHRTRALLERVAQQINVARPPRLLLTQHEFGPAMIGLTRPTIVVPHRLAACLTDDELRPLLAHELVHVKRFDTLVGWLQMVVAAAWWFHPLVWLAIRRLTSTLEMRVDDRTVAEIDICPKRYASSLISAIELLCRPTPIPGSMGLISCRMTGHRIRNVLRPAAESQGKKRSTLMVAALCLVVLPGRGLSVPSEWLFAPIPCGQASLQIEPVDSEGQD